MPPKAALVVDRGGRGRGRGRSHGARGGRGDCPASLPRSAARRRRNRLSNDRKKARVAAVRSLIALAVDRGRDPMPAATANRYGTITGDYEGACRKHGFRPWAGTNANVGPQAQPGDLSDIFPHETVTTWVRARLVKSAHALRSPWQETPAKFAQRLEVAVENINAECDVTGACTSFPERLRQLVAAKGDRLAK